MTSNVRTIVRSRGGTAERVVSVRDIIIPEVPEFTAEQISEQWIRSAMQLRADLIGIVGDLCDGRQPSADLFVPNYWKAAIKLPENQSGPMLELWHVAHDLGKDTMRTDINRFRVIRDGIDGMQYYSDENGS